MTNKDFDNVVRYEEDTAGGELVGIYAIMTKYFLGDWVKYEDYQELLKAYKELKCMYEDLSK